MTKTNEIKEQIVQTLAAEFELEPERLTPEATIYEELGLDSLDAVDMVVVLEKKFQVKLANEEAIRSVRTVNDIFELVIRLHDNIQQDTTA